jgi:hypothetical protein
MSTSALVGALIGEAEAVNGNPAAYGRRRGGYERGGEITAWHEQKGERRQHVELFLDRQRPTG